MKRHVTCFVEKAGFEPRTLGTKAKRYDHCATRPVEGISINKEWENWFRPPFSAHHKSKCIRPISANAGVSCSME
jgi:hypothetical protein